MCGRMTDQDSAPQPKPVCRFIDAQIHVPRAYAALTLAIVGVVFAMMTATVGLDPVISFAGFYISAGASAFGVDVRRSPRAFITIMAPACIAIGMFA